MQKIIKIGSRTSPLALWQTEFVVAELSRVYPELEFLVVPIKTRGDKILDQALSKIGEKGLFTREIEEQLIDGQIDMAIHSLKDMPTELPEGLKIAAITRREDPADVLICRAEKDCGQSISALDELPEQAEIFTSSLRRKCQILTRRPDLKTSDIRGNIGTRLTKFQASQGHGMILAAAGLKRLGLYTENCIRMMPDEFIPACGQGALALEIRQNDVFCREIASQLNDRHSELATTAERSFLASMGGGCQVPMGAYAWLTDGRIYIKAMHGDADGQNVRYIICDGPQEEAVAVGRKAAKM